MAIETNDAIYKHGTNTQVISTGSGIGDGAFSSAGDATTYANVDDAPIASFAFDGTLSGGPAAGTTIDLYAQVLNASGATPANPPSGNKENIYLGSFRMQATVTSQVDVLGPVGLPSLQSGQQYNFYIKNNTGVTITAGATVDIVPKTYGPKV